MRKEFTHEELKKISGFPPERLYQAIIATIIIQERNEDGAALELEKLLRSETPIEEIFAKFADANSGQPFDREQDEPLRTAFIRALSWRRNQLRKIQYAANARNN